MSPTDARDLLERAAAAVTPAETDPASRLVGLGRRSVRRRRAWAAAGSVAAAVAAVVAVPLATAAPDRSPDAVAPGTTVSLDGVSVAVPEGWRVSRVTTLDICTADSHTVYLAARWNPGQRASEGPPKAAFPRCTGPNPAWMAVVRQGQARAVSPARLIVRNEQPIQADQPDPFWSPSVWAYRAFTEEIQATTVFLAGDERDREHLLERVTWPAGPAGPPSGGLMLPDRITSALTDAPPDNHMVVATDAGTLTRIRTTLAALRDPVPAAEQCTLQKPGSVGISISAGTGDAAGEATVVLGDASCPQAVSTGGGRVRVPPGLGRELLDLIVASDRAAAEQATGK